MSEEREDLISAEDAVEEQEELLVEEEVTEEEVAEEEESPEVEKAKKYGHLNKDEWIAQGKDPKDWKSPEEYNKTGEIIDQLMSLRKQIERRDREIQALVDYQQRTSQREYDKAKQDLEQRLKASKDDMDIEGVAHYTKELVRLQDMEKQAQYQSFEQQKQDAQQRFIERNQHWFNDRNPDLKQRAIEIDAELKDLYPNATFDEFAKKIEARMQYEFPERITGQSKVRPAVSPNQSSVNKTAVNKSSVSRTFNSLSQDLKDTYNATKRIVESRGDREYTVNDFIEQLKKDGEL